MADRPAFFICQGKVVSEIYSFEWFPGFAVSQKQKSIESLHSAIVKTDTNARPLEISTKSKEVIGVNLSAFNLKLNGYLLENIFQSAKVFENGGPYLDLLDVLPKEAKRDERLHHSGDLRAFRYQNEDFPLIPKTAFYDFIYISAVKESFAADEINVISNYNYFTDIEFNPAKSINTQARTAALIKLILDEYRYFPYYVPLSYLEFRKIPSCAHYPITWEGFLLFWEFTFAYFFVLLISYHVLVKNENKSCESSSLAELIRLCKIILKNVQG